MRDNKTEKIILEAAEEEFLLKGFAGARTMSIAEKAGVNHAMLHYYFNTKEQLFEQVLMGKVALFKSVLAVVFSTESMSIQTRLSEAVSRHFDFIRQNPMLPRFLINEIAVRPEYLERVKLNVQEMLRTNIAELQRQLNIAARKGEICEVNAQALVMDILSLNLFVFLIHPIAGNLFSAEQLDAFYERRKQENIQTILKRLTPEKPCSEMYY